MQLGRLILLSTFVASLGLAAPDKEIIELNRTVASLEEQVRQLQRALDEKLASVTTLVQQSIEISNRGNTSIGVLENGLRERMAEQQKNLVAPVMSVSSKVDHMTTEFQGLRESVSDLSERMNKL